MDNQNEIFTVVDWHDKIIGYFTRYECHHNKSLIHRVVGVIIFDKNGRVLLQKRGKNKDTNPGLYTLSATGHVDKGETYKQAAQRELFEELGIKSPLARKKKFIVETDIETEMTYIFTTVDNGPFDPNKHEIDGVKFVTITELKNMQSKLTPFAIESLKQINLL